MNTLFISDIHLNPHRPKITAIFLEFLQGEALNAEALYILGDFFDSWIGDDVMDDFANTIAKALHQLVDSGVKVYLMPGNRDFLYGKVFEEKSGVILIPDPTLINLNGTPTLLVHGDSLCSADRGFQIFRYFVRHPVLTWIFLHTPLAFRQKFAQYLRNKSTDSNQKKSAYIMDVDQKTVENMMRKFKATHMIHGHTHDPKIVEFNLDGKKVTRTVLGAWETEGYCLTIS
ncbi:MAG: UDP-2,3-diacylglucosamine diphosphatase [Legionellales bacterium]|jgi:UDP-2,3-diacylglucosamine hydrolase